MIPGNEHRIPEIYSTKLFECFIETNIIFQANHLQPRDLACVLPEKCTYKSKFYVLRQLKTPLKRIFIFQLHFAKILRLVRAATPIISHFVVSNNQFMANSRWFFVLEWERHILFVLAGNITKKLHY